MKASDLRIGNQMKLFLGIGDNGAEYRECGIQGIMIHHSTEFYLLKNAWVGISNNLEPIPLTEEWLLKFGFVYHDDDGIITYSRDNIVIFQRYRLDFYFELSNYKDAELEYVHQLQNLYYALTGEELTHGK
jgi:hypothetical protein